MLNIFNWCLVLYPAKALLNPSIQFATLLAEKVMIHKKVKQITIGPIKISTKIIIYVFNDVEKIKRHFRHKAPKGTTFLSRIMCIVPRAKIQRTKCIMARIFSRILFGLQWVTNTFLEDGHLFSVSGFVILLLLWMEYSYRGGYMLWMLPKLWESR